MTNVQQYLTYIYRELKFMSAGNAITGGGYGNSKFANRVISDVCDIPNFCTSVLSSKKPGEVIMAVLKGPQGTVLSRFFDEQLHDVRVEMVNLLAITSHLMSTDYGFSVKKPKRSYGELYKLYKKSVKELRKMIKNQSSKKSLESMYPALKALTGTTVGYDFDDDDDESYDDEEYVDSWLEAARNGNDLPRPMTRAPRPEKSFFDLTANDDLVETVRRIQQRLGRSLTSKEIVTILQNISESLPEEESEETDLSEPLIQEPKFKSMIPMTEIFSPEFMDQIADMIIARRNLKAQNGDFEDTRTVVTDDLDEFIAKSQKQTEAQEEEDEADDMVPETVTVDTNDEDNSELIALKTENENNPLKVTSSAPNLQVSDPKSLSTKTLIQVRNEEKIDPSEIKGDVPADESAEEEPSEQQGPDDQSGPEYALGSEELDEMVQQMKEKTQDSIQEELSETLVEPEFTAEEEDELDQSAQEHEETEEPPSEPEMTAEQEDQLHQVESEPEAERTQYSYQAQTVADQMAPDPLAKLVKNCREDLTGILTNYGAELTDFRPYLTPAWGGEYVLNLDCYVIIHGDVEDVDSFAIIRRTSELAENIAKIFSIKSKKINVRTVLTTSSTSIDFMISGSLARYGYTKDKMNRIFNIGTYLALLFYKILDKPVDIRYLGTADRTTFYLNVSADEYDQVKEINDILLNTIEAHQYIEQQHNGEFAVVTQVTESDEMVDMYFDEQLLSMFKMASIGEMTSSLINTEISLTDQTLKSTMKELGATEVSVNATVSDVSARDRAGFEIIYNLEYDGNLSSAELDDVKRDFENLHSASSEIRELLTVVSANILVESYLNISQIEKSEEKEEVPETAPDATNAFGM